MYKNWMRYLARTVPVSLMLAISAFACASDEPGKDKGAVAPSESAVEVIPVTIYPVAESKPALEYHLLPTFLEKTPGNALPLYLKAMPFFKDNLNALVQSQGGKGCDFDHVREWLATPLDSFPRERAQKLLDGFSFVLSQMDLMARREHCEWDPPLRQGKVYEILLPEVQEARNMAWLLALRTRLRITEGKYADAVVSLQAGYALARHIADQPFLISGLVGLAVVRIMNEQVLTLCQQPGAPNLYWSLTALPHPIVDLCKSAECEYNGIYLQFPELQDVRRGQHSPEQWDAILRKFVWELVRYQEEYIQDKKTRKTPEETASQTVAHALEALPRAKTDLLAAGYAQKELDAMCPSQIVLVHVVKTWDMLQDDLFKWSNLPYWQAEEGLAAFDHELAAAKQRELIPAASVLLPSLRAAGSAAARVERQLAAMRCIEALRLYAAGHHGQLPNALDDVKEVPIPINPVTGKRFPYHLEGETAVLDADAAGPAKQPQAQYRITVAK